MFFYSVFLGKVFYATVIRAMYIIMVDTLVVEVSALSVDACFT